MIDQERIMHSSTGALSLERLIELNGAVSKYELERALLAARQAQGREERPSVYLSHCAEDAGLLPHLVFAMRRACPDLYVDWCDPDLSPLANDQTTRVHLARIRSARKFIWLASAAAARSAQRHWELGVAAGTKQLNEIALVSLAAAPEDLPTRGFSRVHQRLVEDTRKGEPTGNLMMAFPDDMKMPLGVWLAA